MSVFDELVNMDYEKVWTVVNKDTRFVIECDDREGLMQVCMGMDGDMHVFINGTEMTTMLPSFRARTIGGGGHNQKVRKALLLLAIAISEDEAENGR